MVDKMGTVKNPLTIIAMFSAIAEVSGTVVLPHISGDNQHLFVLFLVLFPFVLIFMFFITLNFSHRVLYAPSDFKDEQNFMTLFKTASVKDRIEKLNEEIIEVMHEEQAALPRAPASTEPSSAIEGTSEATITQKLVSENDIRGRYLLAEQLVLDKLERETRGRVSRNVSIITPDKQKVVFDGIIERVNGVDVVEVKLLRPRTTNIMGFFHSIRRLINAIEDLQRHDKLLNATLMLIIVIDDLSTHHTEQLIAKIKSRADEIAASASVKLELRFFNLSSLEQEIGLQAAKSIAHN